MRLLDRLLQPDPNLDLGAYATLAAWQRHVTARQVRVVRRALAGRGAEGPSRPQDSSPPPREMRFRRPD